MDGGVDLDGVEDEGKENGDEGVPHALDIVFSVEYSRVMFPPSRCICINVDL